MVEDILSEPLETRNRRLLLKVFDERSPIEDAESLIRLEIDTDTVDAQISVRSEDDCDVSNYDPKLRAKTSRPYKPAIYLME